MLIRKTVPSDAAEIANVHIHSWRETYQRLLPDNYIEQLPSQFRARYRLWTGLTQDTNQLIYVAEDKDAGVIGFVNGGVARDVHLGYDAEIYAIYMLKSFHGKGYGIQLIKSIFQDFIKLGCKNCYAWVLDGNPTEHFYKRTGAAHTTHFQDDTIGGKNVIENCFLWNDLVL